MLSIEPFATVVGGLFEQDAYVLASAEHNGATPVIAYAGDAGLVLLRDPAGALSTVYGYPQPFGNTSPEALERLADGLLEPGAPLRIALDPEDAGERLAAALGRRVEPTSAPAICLADLRQDPMTYFKSTARHMARRAVRDGGRAQVGPPSTDFGAHYRAAMDELDASDAYRFSDAYFSRMADAGAVEVTVRDEHGIAAAGLFLVHGRRATYHLSGRRAEPRPLTGAMNLVMLEGLRESARRGAATCILGGGRTAAPDDALLRFKRGLSTRVKSRPIFEVRPGAV